MTVGEALCAVMDDSLVYRKSGLGVAQLAATHGGALSPRERHVLILLEGRRTIGELSGIFGGETVQRVVPELQAKGFAKQVDATLAADWANAITQIQVGPRERPRRQPAPERVSNANPMTWIALVIVLVSY